MTVNEFANDLYEEMEKSLLESNSTSLSIILNQIAKLKSFLNNYKFKGIGEEINFFRHLKPKFYSKFIYHQKMIFIQSHLPLAAPEDIKNYYLKELRKINEYMENNQEFISYYRSQSTSLDEIYFLRKEPDSWLLMNFEDCETDLNFTTIYDYKISKIMAFELLSEFIKSRLAQLEMQPGLPGAKAVTSVNWTGSKVSLVELLYALQSAGSCNNGTIDVKHLAGHFENLFNIDLGNYYRMFQEMRIRKMNRTTFLDQLKDRLIQRMDQADEHPKFK
jgi:hypothetical protein